MRTQSLLSNPKFEFPLGTRDLGDETLERVAQNAKCDAYADFTSGPTVEGASVD
jgi:hypothetical protein